MGLIKKIDGLLCWVEDKVILSLILLALFSGIMQVVLRYVFNSGFHWNEPIFVTLTVWAILFGASKAVRHHVHARVEIFADSLPEKLAHFAGFISYLSSFSLTIFYFWCGFEYVQFVNSLDIISMESGVPDAITYSIVPIAMMLMAIRYALLIIQLFKDPNSRHTVLSDQTAEEI